jgi:hypothetical protein
MGLCREKFETARVCLNKFGTARVSGKWRHGRLAGRFAYRIVVFRAEYSILYKLGIDLSRPTLYKGSNNPRQHCPTTKGGPGCCNEQPPDPGGR